MFMCGAGMQAVKDFFNLSSEKEIEDSIKQRAMQGLCGVEDGERPRDVSTL